MRYGPILFAVVALGGCARGEDAKEGPGSKTVASGADRIRCALNGATDFRPDCVRDVEKGADGEIWVIRHPDGGFRRFVLLEGGRRIATADGVEEVRADRVGNDLEVRVSRQRYLFPVSVPDQAAPTDATKL